MPSYLERLSHAKAVKKPRCLLAAADSTGELFAIPFMARAGCVLARGEVWYIIH